MGNAAEERGVHRNETSAGEDAPQSARSVAIAKRTAPIRRAPGAKSLLKPVRVVLDTSYFIRACASRYVSYFILYTSLRKPVRVVHAVGSALGAYLRQLESSVAALEVHGLAPQPMASPAAGFSALIGDERQRIPDTSEWITSRRPAEGS